ncbi:FAD-binding oxidoreductase [Acidithiobacillus ferriphilus]|uniref:FAD-binding oxidoreductase n=1 Tax=Acidithiobacillus ferriphilus TaxID=1689834 RepID=UPI001C0754E0|nr:FAD-binding oxidoreductase [Acidithiobacillus ferriphilus]MBU2828115.1 FAD-binding oxidoreductase [Acidithiobacillus ferriphilus]
MTAYASWGRYPKATPAAVYRAHWTDEDLPGGSYSLLPYGNGRSYGDSCLNDGGALLDMRGLDRVLDFDRSTGVMRCEAGVLLADILSLVVPMGWFLPVTPGTRFVTVGGAIANDVHGKNHHRTGTFGQHVLRLALRRSDRGIVLCSPTENAELFHATIGGLGLTGAILWADIQLRPIANPGVDSETIRFANLGAFFDLSEESDRDYEYTVAWIDCLAHGKSLGRGLFMRGNHASPQERLPLPPRRTRTFPIEPPFPLINAWSLRAFNSLYYRKQMARMQRAITHYEPFFYPLDGILHWNRMYGHPGFFQYQCVVPSDFAKESIRALLETIATAKSGSFLAVLKAFGDRRSPGLLSFPRPGATLALDFPNQGQRTMDLLDNLDKIVTSAGGAVYPAKDARMSGERFRQYFPRWEEFQRYIDPRFSSSFWRRVMRT